jgi:hypothetical protein
MMLPFCRGFRQPWPGLIRPEPTQIRREGGIAPMSTSYPMPSRTRPQIPRISYMSLLRPSLRLRALLIHLCVIE